MTGLSRFVSFTALSLSLGLACDDNGDSGDDASNPGTGNETTGAGTTEGEATGSTPSTSDGADTTAAGSSGDGATTLATTGDGDSTGPSNSCDPVVPGEWNACINRGGAPDNTLCNWVGLPDSTGYIGCLTAPRDAGNVCMIRDCEDACDCFAPPSTGTAEVVCAEILTGGGTACVLSCADGLTCPDTMECIGGSCYHPTPA